MINSILPISMALLSLFIRAEKTVTSIKSTMANSTSVYRNETYDYIKFNECKLDYKTKGTYPSGVPYTAKYYGMDFSQLNVKESRFGNDYAGFVMLNFNNQVQYDNGNFSLPIRTVVVVVSDGKQAETLFVLFKDLADICEAKNAESTIVTTVSSNPAPEADE